MIYSYKRGKRPIIKYSDKIKFLDHGVSFKPGVNVVVGSNGCGKTTLLASLAILFLAKQQGYTSFKGKEGLQSLFPIGKGWVCDDVVRHNGKSILYLMKYNTSYFDNDNYLDSFYSIMSQNKTSTGESNQYHLNLLFKNKEKLKPVEDLIKGFKANDLWQKRINAWYTWFKQGIVKDDQQTTLLMDEPTMGFDFKTKAKFWTMMSMARDRFQTIIASHDTLPLFIPDINIIECEKGYVEEVKGLIK